MSINDNNGFGDGDVLDHGCYICSIAPCDCASLPDCLGCSTCGELASAGDFETAVEQPMRIFILEDDPFRIASFREWFDGHDITQVDTCAAVDAFQPPYDVIFLDHDLGGRQLEDHHEDNGHRFACLIEERIRQTPIIIHSFSPDGARNIYELLHRPAEERICYLAPFRGRVFMALVSSLLGRPILR